MQNRRCTAEAHGMDKCQLFPINTRPQCIWLLREFHAKTLGAVPLCRAPHRELVLAWDPIPASPEAVLFQLRRESAARAAKLEIISPENVDPTL